LSNSNAKNLTSYGQKDLHLRSSSKIEVNTILDVGRKLSFGFFSPRNDRTNERIASLRRETRVVIGPFHNRGGYADQAHFDNAFETRASSATLLGSLSHFNDKELDGEILRCAGFRTADLRILS
jgi:hypothetical protein